MRVNIESVYMEAARNFEIANQKPGQSCELTNSHSQGLAAVYKAGYGEAINDMQGQGASDG